MNDTIQSEKASGGIWLRSGALLAGLAVAMGAFAAHGLEKPLAKMYPESETRVIGGLTVPASYKYLQDFKTAAEYQLIHALALLAVGLLMRQVGSRRALTVAGWSFLLGIVLFSGSLYVLVLSGVRAWGAVTPLGGVLFLVGWGSFALGVQRLASPA